MKEQEYQSMSEWLKDDAVKLDLPSEEIIQALCEEIERKNNTIEKQNEKFKRIEEITHYAGDSACLFKANEIAQEALKLTEEQSHG